MTPLAWLAVCGAVLVGLYMLQARFRPRDVSVARFLHDLPPRDQRPVRFQPSAPLTRRSFYAQAAMLLLVCGAVWHAERQRQITGLATGVWVLVDTSYSMSARQGGEPRSVIATRYAHETVDHVAANADGADVCFRVSSFDLERRDVYDGGVAEHARAAVDALAPQARGTDLGVLRSLDDAMAGTCAITHIVVVTDRPAPADSGHELPVIWLDVSAPIDNAGIVLAVVPDDPFSVATEPVVVELTAPPERLDGLAVSITSPDGTASSPRDPSVPSRQSRSRLRFDAPMPGDYRIQLADGGSYDGDDRAVVTVPARARIRVDWQLADRSLLDRLNWAPDVAAPQLRVTDRLDRAHGAVPTLVVGTGFVKGRESPIALFVADHPVLHGLDLDLAERSGMDRRPTPTGFASCLRGSDDGDTYVAVRESPRAALVPGLPTAAGDATDVVSARLFFNALRWLVTHDDDRDMLTLLTPAGAPIVGGQDEAPDRHTPRSRGALSDIVAVASTHGGDDAVWPLLLLVATAVFAAERLLSVYGGERWR